MGASLETLLFSAHSISNDGARIEITSLSDRLFSTGPIVSGGGGGGYTHFVNKLLS